MLNVLCFILLLFLDYTCLFLDIQTAPRRLATELAAIEVVPLFGSADVLVRKVAHTSIAVAGVKYHLAGLALGATLSCVAHYSCVLVIAKFDIEVGDGDGALIVAIAYREVGAEGSDIGTGCWLVRTVCAVHQQRALQGIVEVRHLVGTYEADALVAALGVVEAAVGVVDVHVSKYRVCQR